MRIETQSTAALAARLAEIAGTIRATGQRTSTAVDGEAAEILAALSGRETDSAREAVADWQLDGGGFAAIGTDGTRPVVWGVGDTKEAALDDACAQDGTGALRVVAISAERRALIEAGDVSADDLWAAFR